MSTPVQTSFYGNTSGTGPTGPGDTSSPSGGTPVNQIVGYTTDSSGSYIAGIELYYTDSTNYLFGATTSYSSSFTFPEGVIYAVHYHSDTGNIRGLRFKSTLDTAYDLGYLPETNPIFDNVDDTFTDLQVYTGTLGGNTVVWGVSCYYLDSSSSKTGGKTVGKKDNDNGNGQNKCCCVML